MASGQAERGVGRKAKKEGEGKTQDSRKKGQVESKIVVHWSELKTPPNNEMSGKG